MESPSPVLSATLHPALKGLRACIFDAGGTLVHPDWLRLSRIAEEVTGRVFEVDEMGRAFAEMLRKLGIDTQREGFVLPEDTKLQHWTFRRVYLALGLDESSLADVIKRVAASHVDKHLWSIVDPEAARILDELKRQGLIVAVISNTEDGRLGDSLEACGISDRFDLLVDSKLVGHRKPDAAIFRLTLDRLSLEPNETAYVGDSYASDALAACANGLRGVLLDPHDLHPESICPRIRSLGELVNGSQG